ncbi:MAG: HNH endonuclease family protein, partial [Gluconacetobacter sp.]
DNIIVSANIYSSFSIFSSSVWKDYSDKVRKSLMLFDMANITQVRPLLLSVFSNFSVQEVNKTIPMIASWSVRFLICGAGGSGVLEDNYAQRAKDVSDKKIKNATDLFNSFNILPTDIQFQKDFESAKVSKTQLARWYLSELELEKTKNAQKIVNPDTLEVNLEHILPHNPDSSWSISQNLASKCVNMIGNLALMEAKTNSIIGNSSFDDKKSHFSQSSFDLTKEISNFKSWGSQEIEKRQVELAKLAVKRWKNKP